MTRIMLGDTSKNLRASTIPSQNIVLNALIMFKETAGATPPQGIMVRDISRSRFTASTVEQPRRKPYWLSCQLGTYPDM